MSPTQADWEASKPKCPRKIGQSNMSPGHPCGQTMTWHQNAFTWSCPTHGAIVTGHLAAATRRIALEG